MAKKKIAATVKLRTYSVIADAVESGVAYGYQRAHKYTRSPDEETMCSDMYRAVMDALDRVIDMGGGEEE